MNRFLSLIPRSSYSPSRNLFDRFFDDWDVPSLFSSENELIPAFDITENDKEYVVTAELPGVDVKDVEITMSDGVYPRAQLVRQPTLHVGHTVRSQPDP